MEASWGAVSPHASGLRGSGSRRAATAAVAAFLGCASIVALVHSGDFRTVLEGYEHDPNPDRAVPMTAPAQADQKAWKQTVLGMFSDWKGVTNSNVNLRDPSLQDAYRGGGGARVGAYHTSYRPPADTTPEGELLPSAVAAEKQWDAQVAAMQNGQLIQNKAILNSVGSSRWQIAPGAEAAARPPYKPTVILKMPKSGDYKHGMEYTKQAEGDAVADFTADLPEVSTYAQKNAGILAAAGKADSRGAAFHGLEQGLEMPKGEGLQGTVYKAQRPQQLLQTRAVVQGQKLRVQPKFKQLKHGPSGVPFVGAEKIVENKKATRSLGHKVVTEILGDGLQVTDISTGSGATAEPGNMVKIEYQARLVATGKEVDEGTVTIPLGAGRVIKGWDQGLQGLRVGGQRLLIVPPKLGYGDKDFKDIPAKSTLEFDVKLLDVSKPGQRQ